MYTNVILDVKSMENFISDSKPQFFFLHFVTKKATSEAMLEVGKYAETRMNLIK